ncbi:MAG: hypothetical protein ACFNL1_04865, partial [Prevotella histicola]
LKEIEQVANQLKQLENEARNLKQLGLDIKNLNIDRISDIILQYYLFFLILPPYDIARKATAVAAQW